MEATVGLPPAVARTLALLEPGLRDAEPRLRDGYLDLIGDRSPRSTGPAQDLMLTGIVPAVYERWWRPALGRIAKGVFGPGMSEERHIAHRLLGPGPADGVLDVACGPGNFTRDFARAVGSGGLAVGIDASPTMLARAVRDTGAANVAYVRGDAEALPFRDDSFDAVCCFAALHLFADPFTALDHMTRVLTTGGRIAIFTSCRTRSTPLRALDGLAMARGGLRMFDREEITAALRARGFGEIRRRMTGLTQFVGGRLG